MTPNPYHKYQQTQVQTASTGELVVLLYDGAIRFLGRAKLGIDEQRLDAAGADIVRAQNIVLELVAGLDLERGGELAANLRDLYMFMYQTLVQANLKKDSEKIDTVVRLLSRVRDAWQTVVRGGANPAPARTPVLAGGMAA